MPITGQQTGLTSSVQKILILLDLELGITDVDVDDELLADGYLDSLGILDLVLQLETTFGLQLDETELSIENFATVGAIADLVEGKRS